MKTIIKKTTYYTFALLCILIGLYPIIYFVIDRHFGLLSSKSQELLADQIWNIAFYGHIIFGGLALLVGWSQFSSKLRKKNLTLHRNIGKIYLLSVLISGPCGIYIAQFATGGINNVIAFSLSGIIWLATSILAYNFVRKGEIISHQKMMIYSYAVCFSAVTLRFWLPTLIYFTESFITAYQMVSWLSWVPNLFVAYFFVSRLDRKIKVDLERARTM